MAGAVLGVVVIFLSFLFWGYPKIDKILNNGLGKIGKTKISTQQNIKDVKAKLFGDSALRRLEPLETGKSPDRLPDEVYFFLTAPEIKFLTTKPYQPNRAKAENVGSFGSDFEIQKFGGELYLIGYISDEAFAEVGDKKFSSESHAVAPIAWTGGQKAVAIPFRSIKNFSSRYINIVVNNISGTRMVIIDMVYSDATQNPIVYAKETKIQIIGW